MASERSATELLREWRELMDRAVSSAAHTPEALRELLERERALQRELAGRVFAPVDVVFDLLEDSAAALAQQASALEDAGRALGHAAALMKAQAELFERSIAAMREPTDLAKTVTGAPKRPRRRS